MIQSALKIFQDKKSHFLWIYWYRQQVIQFSLSRNAGLMFMYKKGNFFLSWITNPQLQNSLAKNENKTNIYPGIKVLTSSIRQFDKIFYLIHGHLHLLLRSRCLIYQKLIKRIFWFFSLFNDYALLVKEKRKLVRCVQYIFKSIELCKYL